MSFLTKFRDLVGDGYEREDEQYTSHVVLSELEKYEDVGKVASFLLEEKSVIVNAKALEPNMVDQVVSFLEGTLFVLRGEIKQLDEKTFLCVPNSVAIVDKADREPTLEDITGNNLDEELELQYRMKMEEEE